MESDCTFCRIVQGDLPADVLYRSDRLVVFKDINPHAPVHLLIVPKKHIRSINDLAEGDRTIIDDLIFTARQMAQEVGVNTSGYKLLFNVERGGGQVIFHLHLHLLGGWKR
ncbi:MAG: histidine triad nucleotide-binding protein [Desulfobacterales bacterium]|jgi:histidine triad (HIT) family protein